LRLESSIGVVTEHQTIELQSLSYILGSTELQIYCKTNCTWTIEIAYRVPMSSSSASFGSDYSTKTKFTFGIQFDRLIIEPSINWQPTFNYNNNVISISDLPSNSKIELTAAKNELAIFKAIIHSGKIYFPSQLQYALALQQTVLKPQVAFPIAKALDSILTFSSHYDFNGNATSATQDLLSEAICALYLLKLQYSYHEAPVCKRLNTKFDLLPSIFRIAKSLQSALDINSGLLFKIKEGEDYFSPSYPLTACAYILWNELYEVYERTETIGSLLTLGSKWLDINYNSNIETRQEYLLALALVAAYENRTFEFTENLTNKYAPLIAFLPLANSQIAYTKLPREAKNSPLDLARTHAALTSTLLEKALAMMPYGYMWRLELSSRNKGSVWLGILSAVAEGAATSQILLTRKNSPKLAAILADNALPTATTISAKTIASLETIPQQGIGALEWSAYILGFSPLSEDLSDYTYAKIQTPLQIADLQSLRSIASLASVNGVPLTPPTFLSTKDLDRSLAVGKNALTNPAVEFASPYRNLEDNLEPLTNFTSCSLELTGVGKTKALATYLSARLAAGYKCYLFTHTWGETSQRQRSIGQQENSQLLTQSIATVNSSLELELIVSCQTEIITYSNIDLLARLEILVSVEHQTIDLPTRKLAVEIFVTSTFGSTITN
jgi:hypothetical protein